MAIQASGLGTRPGVRSIVEDPDRFRRARTGRPEREPAASIRSPPISASICETSTSRRSSRTWRPTYPSTSRKERSPHRARPGCWSRRPGRAARRRRPRSTSRRTSRWRTSPPSTRCEHERLIDWRSLRIGGLAFSTLPFRLAIDDIALDDFAASLVHRADDTWNLGPGSSHSSDPRSGAGARPAPPQTSGATRPFTIGRITLRGGRFGFIDHALRPSFASELGDIAARLSASFSEAGLDVNGALSGRVDDFAPLTVAGKIRLKDRQPSADWKLDLHDLDLPPASPYAGKYLGYLIEKGKLNLAIACHIVEGKLDTNVRVVVNKLELGPKTDSPNTTGVNVPRTVAILKDRHGVINVDLPISGSFVDRKFDLRQTIRDTVRGVFTKAAAVPLAPLVSIVSIFDGGPARSGHRSTFSRAERPSIPTRSPRSAGWPRPCGRAPNLRSRSRATPSPAAMAEAMVSRHWRGDGLTSCATRSRAPTRARALACSSSCRKSRAVPAVASSCD